MRTHVFLKWSKWMCILTKYYVLRAATFHFTNWTFNSAVRPLSERTGGSDNIVPIVFRSRVHWCAVLCLAFSLHSVYFVFRWHYLAIPAVQSLSETAWNTSKWELETLNYGVHNFQRISVPSTFPWILTAQINSFKHYSYAVLVICFFFWGGGVLVHQTRVLLSI